MAIEWFEGVLRDACANVDYGFTASASFRGQGPKLLRITDIVGGQIDWSSVPHADVDEKALDKFRLHAGDIVIARTGASTGTSVYVDEPPMAAVFASYLVRLRAVPCFDPLYLSYYLKTDEFRSFVHGVTGDKSAQPNASASTLTKAPLRAPKSKSIQEAIGRILKTFDDKIETNQRMNDTLVSFAIGLFRVLFVDVSDELPIGWNFQPIEELADVRGGSTPRTSDPQYWNGGEHHWATPKDLSGLSMPVLLDTARKITDAGLAKISSGLLPAGTVLMSSRAPIGYVAIAEVPVAVNQGFIALKPKKGVSNIFLMLWLREAQEEIVSRANGSTFLEISKKNFRPIPVVTPPQEIMDEFDRQVRPLYQRIVCGLREIQTLAQLRDTLLPKLITGELRIPDAERIVSQVA
jgi:type I restriction enzyme S subunit